MNLKVSTNNQSEAFSMQKITSQSASVVVFAALLSSSQLYVNQSYERQSPNEFYPSYQTGNHISNISSLKSGNTIVSKRDFRERYSKISKSKWFVQAYKGQSLGDVIKVEE